MATQNWRKFPLNRLLKVLEGRLSERKWRLLACAAVRRLRTANRGAGAQAILLAERFADGGASAYELAAARYAGRFQPGHPAWAVCWGPDQNPQSMAERALAWVIGQAGASAHFAASRREDDAQADLLRDLAGHRFQDVAVDPLWLAWSDAVVVKLARSIYEERAFEQMPILGDALEEAGCNDAALLLHCRQGGEHVRGCWLLDLLLGLS